MWTGCASPRSPPTLLVGSCRTWSCGTAAAPEQKTGSATRKTPGLTNLPLHDFTQNQEIDFADC